MHPCSQRLAWATASKDVCTLGSRVSVFCVPYDFGNKDQKGWLYLLLTVLYLLSEISAGPWSSSSYREHLLNPSFLFVERVIFPSLWRSLNHCVDICVLFWHTSVKMRKEKSASFFRSESKDDLAKSSKRTAFIFNSVLFG